MSTTLRRLVILGLIGLISSTMFLTAQSECSLFKKSITIDTAQTFAGNGQATFMGSVTAWSTSGARLAQVRVTLRSAEQQLHCPECDTTWSPTPGLVVRGTLVPSMNIGGNVDGIAHNQQHQYITWGSTDPLLREPLLHEDPFQFELAVQFNSPRDSATTTIHAELNFAFTDVNGRECDTTLSVTCTSIHAKSPFYSTYAQRVKNGVLVREIWRTEHQPSLVKVTPVQDEDNAFAIGFAWRRSDMNIDMIEFNSGHLRDTTQRITRVTTTANNVNKEYTPNATGRITVPVADLMIADLLPNAPTAEFGTFAAKIHCEQWQTSSPASLQTSIAYRYTPNRSAMRPRWTGFEDYSCIRPSKVGSSGLEENTSDPKPVSIKAYMLSFVNDNPTKRSVFSLDLRPLESSVRILGIGNIGESSTDGGITAWIDNSNNCESCIRMGNVSNPSPNDPMVPNSYGATSLGSLNPALYWIDACCRQKDRMYISDWWQCVPHDLLPYSEFNEPVNDGPGHLDPTISYSDASINPNIDIRSISPVEFQKRPKPMLLFIANAGSTTPLAFAARDDKGKIVSRGTVILKSVVSSVDVGVESNGLHGSISPSPASDGATLNFYHVDEAEPVAISLVDLYGDTVKTIAQNARLSAGFQAIYFDTSSVPSGSYVVQLSSGRATSTYKLIVKH